MSKLRRSYKTKRSHHGIRAKVSRCNVVLRRLFVLACLTIGFIGCRDSKREEVVTLLISGDTQGWITPCGCAANQSGGLPRRGALVNQIAEDTDVLVLDAGGSAIGAGPYQRLKLEYLFRGMHGMGLQIHNLGASELALPPAVLREISAQTGVKWISTNLHPKDGNPVGPHYFEQQRSGLTVAVVGVIDPTLVEKQMENRDQWQVSDPVQSVLSAFKNRSADVKVVLAYFDEAGLRRLAESLPEVDYIIGGPTGQCMSPTRVGRTTLMSVTNKGKFLGKIALQANAEGFVEQDIAIVEVTSELPENARQLQNLDDYHAALAERDFTAEQSQLQAAHFASAPIADVSVSGSASCVKCHQADDSVWHNSKHSHAWEPLVLKNSHFDPQCQQCHTTGYGLTGGFVNVARSTEQVHVGCENCHGPSAAHVADPRRKTPFQAKEQCIRCHDHENSPLFNFDQYWPRVFHDGKRTTAELSEPGSQGVN